MVVTKKLFFKRKCDFFVISPTKLFSLEKYPENHIEVRQKSIIFAPEKTIKKDKKYGSNNFVKWDIGIYTIAFAQCQ